MKDEPGQPREEYDDDDIPEIDLPHDSEWIPSEPEEDKSEKDAKK